MQEKLILTKEETELFIAFNSLFKKYTGVPLTYLKYEIDSLKNRIESIELTLKQTMPVMAATTLKLESVVSILEQDGVMSENQISSFSKKLITSM